MLQQRRHTSLRVSCIGAALGALGATVACGGAARAPVEQVAALPPAALAPFPIPVSRLASAPGALITAAPVPPVADGVSSVVSPALPEFSGMWTGLAVRRSCSESGGAVGLACRVVPERQRVELEITQSGGTVRGLLTIGRQEATVTGNVRRDGTLVLRGVSRNGAHTISVPHWQATIDGAGMYGTFSYRITAADERLGAVTVTAALDGLAAVP
jgi:hypothetical protein